MPTIASSSTTPAAAAQSSSSRTSDTQNAHPESFSSLNNHHRHHHHHHHRAQGEEQGGLHGDSPSPPSSPSSSSLAPTPIIIRDWAYPENDPRFSGHGLLSPPDSMYRHRKAPSDATNRVPPLSEGVDPNREDAFTGPGKALYDFTAENSNERSVTEGQDVWIRYRQCAGWLIVSVGGEDGLVPEDYILVLR